jgi:hypothetical protein
MSKKIKGCYFHLDNENGRATPRGAGRHFFVDTRDELRRAKNEGRLV